MKYITSACEKCHCDLSEYFFMLRNGQKLTLNPTNMNRTFLLSMSIIFLSCGLMYSQSSTTEKERDWRFEIEPSSYIFNGFSLHIGRNLTKDNKLSTAFYALATDVPNALQQRIFENTGDDHDVRVGLQLTLNTRYILELLKDRESNPYLGLVTGWEYFTLNAPNQDELRVDVLLLTPYLGWEIYLYKDILYLNPQIRSVIYLNPTYSTENREESINPVFLLPQVSIGARF